MTHSVKNYTLTEPMSNEEVAKRLGVSCDSRSFTGFYLDDQWVGGRHDQRSFTVSLRPDTEHLHQKAAEFATFSHES